MKKQDIQFKATAGLVILLLLACSVIVFALTPTSTLADDHNDTQAFIGTVSGTIPEDLGPPVPGSGGCVFNFFVPNSGKRHSIRKFHWNREFYPERL